MALPDWTDIDLTDEEVEELNNKMCPVAHKITLGDLLKAIVDNQARDHAILLADSEVY